MFPFRVDPFSGLRQKNFDILSRLPKNCIHFSLLFPFEVEPFQFGGKTILTVLSCRPENVSIPFNLIVSNVMM